MSAVVENIISNPVSDFEIVRASRVIFKRLERGSPAFQNSPITDVTKFSAVLCRDGKIRLTQWYHNLINTSGVMLSDKITELGDVESNFEMDSNGWQCVNSYTMDGIVHQLEQARKMMD